ncbi:type I restriction enzyme HsdR N-terminal domain-containing protein [Crocinitomicaceae bacterium]|jgi:hypothetical protein|nr:type I restriction enzyme HsdR N-terminal domain-containing protein [Crocinitomicaceae bacterium]
MYPRLNLPLSEIPIRGEKVRCRIRKKDLLITPEEWVRQQFIYYLIDHLNYPAGRMTAEQVVVYNKMRKRCDIALYDDYGKPLVIVECKAPHIKITQDTFLQIARYAHTLKAPFLILTNGLEHFCAYVNAVDGSLQYLKEIPNYEGLIAMIS